MSVGLDTEEPEVLAALTKSRKIGELETDASGVLEVEGIPPSVYNIKLLDDRMTSYHRSKIEAGASKTFTIDLRRFAEVSASFPVPPDELVKKTNIRLVKESDETWRDIFFFEDLNPTVLVGPGVYHWDVSFLEAVGWESPSFTVSQGDQPSEQHYTIELAKLKVVLTGNLSTPMKNGTLMLNRFESQNALKGYFSGIVDFDSSGSTVEFYIPAGIYELNTMLGAQGTTKPTRVDIQPGTTNKADLQVTPRPIPPKPKALLEVG